MDLKALKEAGAFVPAELVEKSVTWRGHSFTVKVRRLPYGDVERLFLAFHRDADRCQTADLISECIRLGDGKESMSYQDAYRLEPDLARALADAIKEVNELGADEKN